jgi:Protein of unknown function (DUF2905)
LGTPLDVIDDRSASRSASVPTSTPLNRHPPTTVPRTPPQRPLLICNFGQVDSRISKHNGEYSGDMDRGIGPWLAGIGVLLVIVGVLAWAGLLSWFGRLPGDIRITREHVQVYIPITSMLLVSAAISIILWLFSR